ncbi:hypothetical protein J4464_03560 [Candidatus Woesearchaeota archaeon]|nr:hypothetical protein [Candidatus Woesearchaeota archaeon]
MTRIIPRELIKHLEWIPGQQPPQRPAVNPTPQPVQQRTASIDALVNGGREFFSEQKDSNGNYIGVAVALQEAYDQMGSDAIIATMPYLVAGKAQAEKSNYLWQKWFTALSEENAGIDKNGKLVGRGQPVVLTLHGRGILTPERIRQAYSEGLTPQNAAKFTDDEFDNLLNGVLPSGESINLYTVDDIKRGISDPFGRYAVWMPAETAKSKSSGHHSKSDFMNNELVIARVGTLEHLDAYFEKARHSSNHNLGNWHRLGEIDFTQPQGRVLFVGDTSDGLSGINYLNSNGRFVGVRKNA